MEGMGEEVKRVVDEEEESLSATMEGEAVEEEEVTVEEAVERMEQMARETAVGDTMYEKRSVRSENCLVGGTLV